MTATDVARTIDAVWRIESARLIGALARRVHDVGLAEELAQDVLVVALEEWPKSGIPHNPGAWLMTTAWHRAIDQLRRRRRFENHRPALEHELEMAQDLTAGTAEASAGDAIGDDLLRLMFIACHPLLPRPAHTALTLRLLGGLSTREIARAFLVPEATIAQRIVRAKRTLAEAGVPFELPPREELAARLASVLEVIYLIFNEGYAATAGEAWTRPLLCEEALRIGRILAELTPQESEVHALVALMEIQASRLRARVGPSGEPVLLMDQNRAQWDRILIHRGLLALARAEALVSERGPYLLQAAIAACHARATEAAATDWVSIAGLYDELARDNGSPVIELNRAVAIAMAYGPAAGLELADRLAQGGELANYHLLPSVRADLLARLGRYGEARAEFERAAELTSNTRERELLARRAAACAASPGHA